MPRSRLEACMAAAELAAAAATRPMALALEAREPRDERKEKHRRLCEVVPPPPPLPRWCEIEEKGNRLALRPRLR